MNSENAAAAARAICQTAPVIPVLVIHDLAHARPLAEALVAGGLPCLEVTLRTDCALAAIEAMAAVPGAKPGVGTLRTPADVVSALNAGATFGVSPGATDPLLEAAEAADLPLLPGAATASEAMRLLERGYKTQKFFPAEAVGGAPALKSLAGPLPDITFCPTGGVSPRNAAQYLALPNTVCVGGSWVAPQGAMERGEWQTIEALARDAAALATG